MIKETHTTVPTVGLHQLARSCLVGTTSSQALWEFFNGSVGHRILSVDGKHTSLDGMIACYRQGIMVPSILEITKDTVTITPTDMSEPFDLIYFPQYFIVKGDNRLLEFAVAFGSGMVFGALFMATGIGYYMDRNRY